MKKWNQIAALMLAIVLTLSLTVTAFAAVEDTGFSDVDANAWYAEAVAYCREQGLMSGTAATAFEPDGTLTRAMLVSILYRNAGNPTVTGSDTFRDTVPGAYYADAVLWASQQGLVSGYDNGLFGTDDPVSREQMTAILWRCAGSPAASESTAIRDRAETAPYAAAAVDWASANQIVQPVSDGIFDPKSNATRAQAAAALMQFNRSAQTSPETGPNGGSGAKVLIAYFSATNTTKPLAEYLADGLNAGLYEIVPETPYTAADLDYGDASSRTSVEMNDRDSRPAIAGGVNDMAQYDVVFLGYPIWWGQAPRIVCTFLESYDFAGKTIVPFCTSGSSGIGSSAANLHGLTSGATWLDGQRFSGGTSRDAMLEWANGLGLDLTGR